MKNLCMPVKHSSMLELLDFLKLFAGSSTCLLHFLILSWRLVWPQILAEITAVCLYALFSCYSFKRVIVRLMF